MTTDINYYLLKYESNVTPVEDYTPADYVYETKGEILSIDDKDQETLVGKFCLYYIDIDSARNDEVNIYYIFDSFSQTTETYYHAIYNSNGSGYSKKLEALLDLPLPGNVLILDRLEILPAFRGKKLGLIIIRRLIQRFSSGAAIVAIEPHPIQYNSLNSKELAQWYNEMQFSNFSDNKKDAINKLRQYYQKLGFFEMQGTPFMFMSTEWKLPTINELKAL